MLIRRTDIDKITCAKCGKPINITLEKGDIIGSLHIKVNPCNCSNLLVKIIKLFGR